MCSGAWRGGRIWREPPCASSTSGLARGDGRRVTMHWRCWTRIGLGLVLAIAWGLTGTGRAWAGGLSLWGIFQPHTAREALADGYGRAIVREFGAILLASADKACLDARGLDAARLEMLGADLLARYG